MYYKCHEINPSCNKSYIDSAEWIKNKKTTKNQINENDNKLFEYAVTVALNHEKIRKYPERLWKIKPFIDKNDWEGINYPPKKDVGKIFEKNNLAIAFNVYYAQANSKQLFTGYLYDACAVTSDIVLIKIMTKATVIEIRIVFSICYLQSLYEVELGHYFCREFVGHITNQNILVDAGRLM